MLNFDDWVCLSRADMKAKKIEYDNRLVSVDPESINRLADAGMCDKKGNLTKAGVEKAKEIKARLDTLRKGVPIEERKKTNHHKVGESEGQWLTGTLRKREYVSDGFFMLYASPYASMEAVKGGSKFRGAVPIMVRKVLSMKDLIELRPRYWQMQFLGGLEIIWLCDNDGSTMVPVQAMYFDFTLRKYPSAKFFGIKGSDKTPVQIQVKNRGLPGDVVGVMHSLDLKEQLPKPIFGAEGGSEEKKEAM